MTRLSWSSGMENFSSLNEGNLIRPPRQFSQPAFCGRDPIPIGPVMRHGGWEEERRVEDGANHCIEFGEPALRLETGRRTQWRFASTC